MTDLAKEPTPPMPGDEARPVGRTARTRDRPDRGAEGSGRLSRRQSGLALALLALAICIALLIASRPTSVPATSADEDVTPTWIGYQTHDPNMPSAMPGVRNMPALGPESTVYVVLEITPSSGSVVWPAPTPTY